jgi:hypothetical protein
MAPIIWSSWIADEKGNIDYKRVGFLVSSLLGLIGGIQLLIWMGGGMDEVPFDRIKFVTPVCIAPLFATRLGSGLAHGLARAKQRRVVKGYRSGQLSDRRTLPGGTDESAR